MESQLMPMLRMRNLWMALLLTLGAAGALIAEQKVLERQSGYATYYSSSLHGKRTASGSIFDNQKLLAAHRSYPFGTVVRVTNIENGKSVEVVIVDRGPFGLNRKEGAIIDVSQKAAQALDMKRQGQVKARVDVLAWGKGRGGEK
jgi:rare lipoprotein A